MKRTRQHADGPPARPGGLLQAPEEVAQIEEVQGHRLSPGQPPDSRRAIGGASKETNLDLPSGVAVEVRFETIDDSDVSLPVFTLFP